MQQCLHVKHESVWCSARGCPLMSLGLPGLTHLKMDLSCQIVFFLVPPRDTREGL